MFTLADVTAFLGVPMPGLASTYGRRRGGVCASVLPVAYRAACH